jgi:hypothetical protein
MKQNFFKITASNRFQAVVQFLRKELGWKASDPLVRVTTSHIKIHHSDHLLVYLYQPVICSIIRRLRGQSLQGQSYFHRKSPVTEPFIVL